VSEELPAADEAAAAGVRSGGTWGSVLSCQELAAVGSVGFAPVGQVFGAAVYAAGSASGSVCPGASPALSGGMPVQSAAREPGRDDPGGFGPLADAMYQARRAAVDRMAAECAALGGHGVVGVRLARGPFALGGLEFTAAGTAVRAAGAAPGLRVPFTCAMAGQDFARLVMAGWVPAGLVLGIAIGSRHDDRATVRQGRPWSGNAEMAGWTTLVNQTRQEARCRLEDDVRRLGAEGVVIAGLRMRARERDCPVAVGRHDHVVEVTLTGTAITSFSRSGHRHAGPPLTVMPVGTWSPNAPGPRCRFMVSEPGSAAGH
jgi:uncharacterized protein YbjQ (UPF0145 family)